MPEVSVIIPVYNTQAKYLQEATQSIMLQTFTDWELIIIDDGSSKKETLEELEEIKSFNMENIFIIHQENKKISGALNAGIKEMRGQWWAGLSSDDKWRADKLEKQIAFIEKNPKAKIIYSDWEFIDLNSKVIKKYIEPEFKTQEEAMRFMITRGQGHFATWSGQMIHREVFSKIGLFNEDFPCCEDYEMNIRLLKHYMMYKIPEALFQYRLYEQQLTRNIHRTNRDIYIEIARSLGEKYLEDNELR